ncbi:hypothetical protein GUITHDRAFT_141024 [Guillardia theta CCMP2712]|uniref:Spindle and kinetochore-associated protein 3 n=1 Tax=Guillardia theta (strain CCMP2712) TaxID=905079 RepID=L1J241_GUITC|nr:hypothetical protein GUITHDRAFT_141024 [Guillardia theta CCMP2712]EKX42591.1 hypothetical protein GUITHDRAFT_141024 [Guillardia theta CCMP2712]|eukprot:XP_005829571.1 hypothetical protein GUITHDRAFT_141024 [Guillardia theta CCMP2712]
MATFLHELSSFAMAVDEDRAELKAALQHPPASSGAVASRIPFLEDMKEICKVYKGMSAENQKLIDCLECQLESDPANGYVPFNAKCLHDIDASLDCMQDKSKLSLVETLTPCVKKASIDVSVGVKFESPAPVPAYLQVEDEQVEPKTPDLEDFAISSLSLGILNEAASKHPAALKEATQRKEIESSAPKSQPGSDENSSPNFNFSPLHGKYEFLKAAKKSPEKIPFHLPECEAEALSNPPAPPAELPAQQEEASSLQITSRSKVLKAPAEEARGESMFPLMAEVSGEDFAAVPDYLRHQISCDELNTTIKKINEFVTDKRFEQDMAGGSDALTIEEMQQKIKLGVKTKAFVLLLMSLSRIKTVKAKTGIAYTIVSQ